MQQIIGVGVDNVEISRALKAAERNHFLEKYYSEAEREIIQQRKSCAATNFAGKEAVVKALGTGFAGIEPKDVEILRRENGAPFVRLQGGAKRIAEEKGITGIHISLTDSRELATAFAVCVGDETVSHK